MKRELRTKMIAVVLTIVALAMGQTVWAETSGNIPNCNLTWNYNTTTKTLTIGGSGAMTDLQSGSSYKMPWEKSGSDYKNQIEYIVIGKDVTTIGNYSFDNLSNLLGVTFEAGSQLTSIGTCAFDQSKKLANITLPASLTRIGDYAFRYTALTSITIPASVTTIGANAFASSKLATVTFEAGSQLTTIENYAFQYTDISSITIPESVTYLGGSAFYYCDNLSSVTLPNSITSINMGTFRYCTNLNNITIPSSVTSIRYQAFKDSGLTSATIQVADPTTLTIENEAFTSGVTFNVYNTDIWAATYPSLSFSPIASTQSWESGDTDVKLYEDGTVIVSKKAGDGNGAMADYKTFSDVPWRNSVTAFHELVVLSGVTTIGECAFEYSQILTSAVLPASVTTIKEDAFFNCNRLASVNIPGSVKTIEATAFMKCSSLSSLTLNEGLATIAVDAFGQCTSLTSVSIPSTVSSIHTHAFHKSNNLKTISVDANNATYSSVDGLLLSKDMTTLVICPAGKSGGYTIPNCVTTIGGYSFHDCTGISSVTIPASVTIIDIEAFDGCTNLSSVTIYAPSLTEYGMGTFNNNAADRKIYVFSDCVNTYKSNTFFLYVNEDDIKAIADVTVNGVTVNQNPEVTSDYWCTYYHPLANVKVNTTGVEIYKAALNGTNSVTLTKVDGNVIKAGQAVMLKAPASGSLSMELTPAAATGDYSGNELKGGATVADGYTAYTLAAKNGKMGFYKFTGTALNPNKAYLAVANNTEAPAFIGFGETMSLTPALPTSLRLEGSDYYTLDGRKLQGQPTQKGIYIRGGRIIIKK